MALEPCDPAGPRAERECNHDSLIPDDSGGGGMRRRPLPRPGRSARYNPWHREPGEFHKMDSEETASSLPQFIELIADHRDRWFSREPTWGPWFRGHQCSKWNLH